jgi:hypothetical protein
LSDIDFESKQVQQASWNAIRAVMLNAMVEAVARARDLHPVDTQQETAIREGMILNQLHMITASVLGETEGKILRYTMTTLEQVETQRLAYLEAGRVGVSVKT